MESDGMEMLMECCTYGRTVSRQVNTCSLQGVHPALMYSMTARMLSQPGTMVLNAPQPAGKASLHLLGTYISDKWLKQFATWSIVRARVRVPTAMPI